uniref:HIT domain-containing protein n=1 Tax=Anabas testudineus TaxID=64144 RepID=A0A7N6AWK4_ANATE
QDSSQAASTQSHPGLFSRIVRGEEQQWRLWEDEGHVAFLTPFPNSPGFTVLVPRRPLTSDIFRLEKGDYESLVLAARKVSHLLEEGLGAWGVGLIFEGFEIDYAHAKLIPLFLPSSGRPLTWHHHVGFTCLVVFW